MPLSGCILVMRLFLPLPLIGHCCSFFSIYHNVTLFIYAYVPDVNQFNLKWEAHVASIGKYGPMSGCHPHHLSSSIITPHTPQTPLHRISVVPSLVSSQVYLCCLIFSRRPDEVVSMCGGCESVSLINWINLLCLSIQEIP